MAYTSMEASRAQASVELMAILGISLIVILAFSVLSSDFLSDINVNRNYADAHDAVEQIVNAADSVYAQGEGASVSIWVKIPGNANLTNTMSYIGRPTDAPAGTPSNGVNLRVGDSDVLAIAKETVTGSFPPGPGVYQLKIVSRGNYVTIGNYYVDADKSSIYESMAPGEHRTETITFTSASSNPVHILITKDWSYDASSIRLDLSQADFTVNPPPADPPTVNVLLTAGANSGGLYNGQLQVQVLAESEGEISLENFTIPITAEVQNGNGNQLRVNMNFLLAGQAGQSYDEALVASYGSEPYTWSASGLPPGLSINKASIVGTPAASGTYIVTLTATDKDGLKASKRISLTIAASNGGGGLAITTSSLPDGIETQAYSATLEASGGTAPYTWAVSGLSPDLTYGSGTGVISGTVKKGAAAGSPYSVSATVTDAVGGTATANLNLNINAAGPLAITTSSLPDGAEGTKYSAALEASGGVPPYLWTVNNLPKSLAYDSGTGAISGTPDTGTSAKSPYSIDITVTDTLMNTATASLPLAITGGVAPLAITTSSLPDGACNTKYGPVALAATGGAKPYSWTVNNLPHGMSYDGSSAIIGTPDEAGGPCSICIQLDDTEGGHAYVELPLSVSGGKGCSIWSCTISVCN